MPIDPNRLTALIRGVQTAKATPISGPPNFQPDATAWPPRDRGTVGALQAALQLQTEITALGAVVATLERGQENAVQLTLSPHNPDPKPGTYRTWTELYAAFLETQGGVRIWLDYAHGDFGVIPGFPAEFATFTIPAGHYEFQRRATVIGDISSVLSVLVPDGGVTIQGLGGFYGAVGMVNMHPNPVIQLGEFGPFLPEVLALERGATIGSLPGAGPLVEVGTGPSGQSVIALTLEARILDLGAPCVQVVDNGTLILATFASIIDPTVVQGGPTTALLEIVTVGNVATSLNQTNMAGFQMAILNQPANQLLYTPANPADWGSSVPAQVAEALDALAAAIGPLP